MSVALEQNLVRRANVADLLRRSAAQYGDKVALVSPQGDEVTFTDLHVDANAVARLLQAEGVGTGDFVAMLFRNSADFFRVYFGCARLGAIALPLNPGLTMAEYAHMMGECRPTVLVAHGDLVDMALEIRDAVDSIGFVVAAAGSEVRPRSQTDDTVRSLSSLLADHRGARSVYHDDVEVIVESEAAVQCIYTSGTTAKPKGVLTSHLSVLFTATSMAHHTRVTNADTALVLFPNHHVAGLNNSVIPCLMVGATVVLLDGWDPARVATALHDHGVTLTILTGPMVIQLTELDDAAAYDWTDLRLIILGISSLPPARAARVRELCPRAKLLLASGQTEFTGYEEGVLPEHEQSKPDAWGNPTLMTDVAIIDETGSILPVGAVGEIAYRGPQALLEYHGQPDLTVQSFAHGWFHSGDLGYVDEDNTVFFVDRKKDMIKTGGENVASIEVAQAILGHEQVVDCTVVGIPHERWTEAITAFVKARPGADLEEEDVLKHCRDVLAPFKVPKRVIFLDEFPRTATQKIRNVELRQTYADLYA